jgi:hypothetical protein
MGNYLEMADTQRVLVLLELGWSYRKVQRETGVRCETAARSDPRRTAEAANLSTGQDRPRCPPARPRRVSPTARRSPRLQRRPGAHPSDREILRVTAAFNLFIAGRFSLSGMALPDMRITLR